MKVKEKEINISEYNISLEEVLYRELSTCLEEDSLGITWEGFVTMLKCPHEIGFEIKGIIYRFKINI